MKRYLLIGMLIGMMMLAGCPGAPEPMPGSDRDEHGCIPSAGYSWCEEKQKCYRPWEENCTEQQILGGDRDEHGCIPSAGYSWCESLGECIRPWETECPEGMLVGNDSDEHGCKGSAGYSWCESLGECIRPWETECPEGMMVGNDSDAHGCKGSAGYSWCEEKQKCYRPWEENCTAEEAPECITVADCGLGAASCVDGKCSQYDEHGCVPDGGYSWCESLGECIRPWETHCPLGD